MFGFYRFILSIMVVLTHIWPSSLRWAGYYAVFSFFLLSGYLMTLVLNERYGFTTWGITKYLANRVLRVYPPYLVVFGLSLLLVIFLPDLAREKNVLMKLPVSMTEWLVNFTIIGAAFDTNLMEARLIPPVWSLHVEFIFYIALAFIFARSGKLVLIWFLASVAYTLYALFHLDFAARYYTVLAGSLAFSLGSLIYFLKKSGKKGIRLPTWLVFPAAAAFIINFLFAAQIWPYVMVHGFYTSLGISAILVLSLGRLDPKTSHKWISRADRFLGDLSYPMFLVHWAVAIVIIWLVFGGAQPSEPLLFTTTVPVAAAVSYAIHTLVESKINLIRDRVRKGRRTPGHRLN